MIKKAIKLIGRILSGILTAVLVLILVVVMQQKLTGNVPGLFGYHLMYVLTGSMSPELEAGDSILVKKADAETLQVGDVICYYGTSGEMAGQLITHKVIRAPYEEDGKRFLQTKGVANPVADEPIETSQVFGKVVFRLRLLGKLYKYFCTVPGLITVLTPIAVMMVLEIRSMVLCVKEDIAESTEEAKRKALQAQGNEKERV